MTTKYQPLTLICLLFVLFMTSCTAVRQSMREPNTRVELERKDFTLSPQVTADAKSVKVLGIDWARLFRKEEAYIGDVPVLSTIPLVGSAFDKTANYALYNMLRNNPGYDVVFYPQYETKVFKPVLGIGFITRITTVNAKARLGKLETDVDAD